MAARVSTWILNPARDLDSVSFLSPALEGEDPLNPFFPTPRVNGLAIPCSVAGFIARNLSAHLETRELSVFLVFRFELPEP